MGPLTLAIALLAICSQCLLRKIYRTGEAQLSRDCACSAAIARGRLLCVIRASGTSFFRVEFRRRVLILSQPVLVDARRGCAGERQRRKSDLWGGVFADLVYSAFAIARASPTPLEALPLRHLLEVIV